jgi:DNA-binding response OmpR family regulator
VLLDALSDAGYDVATADSLADARALVADGRRPLLVADFWGRSQFELAEHERQEIADIGRSVPLVLLTGRAWASHVTHLDLGVAAVVHKPFDLDELIEQVGQLANIAD